MSALPPSARFRPAIRGSYSAIRGFCPAIRGFGPAIVCLLVAVAGVGAAWPVQADWLDLRRGGPEAIVQAARVANAPEPWIATYSVTLPAGHPLHGLKLILARAPSPTGKLLIRLEGPASLHGVGGVVADGKAWLKLPRAADGKPTRAQPASHEAMFAPLPGLGLPLGLWLAPELPSLYKLHTEGEFGDVAILRLRPRYEAGPGLQPLKLGVSKQHAAFVQCEVTDLQGKPLQGVLGVDLKAYGKVVVPTELRLRPKASEEGVLVLKLDGVRTGKDAGKLKFDASALK